MKRLFRERKASFSSSSKSKTSTSAPEPPAPAQASVDAPLYARFSTVHRGNSQNGQVKPVVSGPMQLSSKTSRSSITRSQTTNGSGGAPQDHRRSRVLTRKSSRQEPTRQEIKAATRPEPESYGNGRGEPSRQGRGGQGYVKQEWVRQEPNGHVSGEPARVRAESSRPVLRKQEPVREDFPQRSPIQNDLPVQDFGGHPHNRQDLGRQERGKQQQNMREVQEPQVLASPPARSTSISLGPAPVLPDIAIQSSGLDFSSLLRTDSSQRLADEHEDSPHVEPQADNASPSRPADYSYQLDKGRRARTSSYASSSSGSARSSSPPLQRRLVVRNATPEDSDDAPEPEAPADIRNSDLAAINMFVNSPASDEPAPPSQPPAMGYSIHGRFTNGHGFAIQEEEFRAPPNSGFRKHESMPSAIRDAASPISQPTRTTLAPSNSRSPAVGSNGFDISSPKPVPARSPPSALLQSSPSLTRKKYSPLAAFGLPARQPDTVPAAMSMTSLVTTESGQTKQASSSDADEPARASSSKQPVSSPEVVSPVLANPPTRHSSKQYSRSEGKKAMIPDAREPNSQGSSKDGAESPAKRSRHNSQNQRRDNPERPLAQVEPAEPVNQEVRKSQYIPPAPEESPPPPPYEEVYDLSNTPPRMPLPLQQGAVTTEYAAGPSQTVLNGYDPNFAGPSNAQPTLQRGPSVRLTPSRQSAYIADQALRAVPQPGRPLIFRAMESTSEVHGIEPEIVGMIGKASVHAKSQEVYNTYYSGSSQTSTPPPEARARGQEKDAPAVKKKHSKLHKRNSSSKFDPVRLMMQGIEKQHEAALKVPETSRLPPQPAVRRESHRKVSASADFRAGPPVPPKVEYPRMDKNISRHMSLDPASVPRRGREAVRHLTDKQRDMLQHRQSYAGDMPVQAQSPPMENRRSLVNVNPHMPQWHADAAAYAAQFPRATAYIPAEMAHVPPPMPPVPGQSSMPYQAPMNAGPSQHPPTMPMPMPQPSNHYGGYPADGRSAYVPPVGMLQQGLTTSPTQVAFPEHPLPPLPMPTPPETTSDPMRKRTKKRREKDSHSGQTTPSSGSSSPPKEFTFYPLSKHLRNPTLLEILLGYLSFYEWTNLAVTSKRIRRILFVDGREQVLERYLRTVGYTRWMWGPQEPLTLSVQDLCNYMRGVSIPSFKYAAIANSYLQANDTVDPRAVQELAAACRAFTRVVLRLRCQAEAEAAYNARAALTGSPSATSLPGASSSGSRPPANGRSPYQMTPSGSRSSSRAPSPNSSYTTLPGVHTRSNTAPVRQVQNDSASGNAFQSPLFRLRRAPLLQVFVPSPEGDWLSDASVLECEAELKRAGVLHLLRAGDVVWDVAAGDEGNVGRLIWDGSYLIDLDYTYSRVGDPPKYLPSLAFPPSYFHRIIRTMGMGNPVVRIDVSPWGEEIMRRGRLLQDRIKTETPQGGHHTVVRWVYRSSFTIRAPPGSKSIRLPMPRTAGAGPSPTGAWVVDPDWYGTVVVETEGTNEGQADLQLRCQGMMPGRMGPEADVERDRRTVWRILRERSRPGEIWIRAVTDKERLLSG